LVLFAPAGEATRTLGSNPARNYEGSSPILGAPRFSPHLAPKKIQDCVERDFLIQKRVAFDPMKPFFLLLVFLMTVAAALADDAIKIVSPDNATTLVVDKSGKRDLIVLHSGKLRHRLFYEDLDTLFRAKLATAFNASLNKVGKVVLPTFKSARWISPDEVEIKGESTVIINEDSGDEFQFTAVVSKNGKIKDLAISTK
jgi:hypothetical protein